MARARRWSLADKVVLVTGGARGIGAAGAAELRRRGARPVLADVDAETLLRAAADLGCPSVRLDVTDYAACERAVAEVVEQHGRLDAVWANAGIAADGPLELIPPWIWTRVIEVNLIGAYNTVRAALPAVIDSRGYVAITASLASFMHAPLLSAYNASKAGVEAMADSLRIEVKHQGVDVGTIHPTWIDTDMVRDGDGHKAFARLRSAMRPPFNRTHPVDDIIPSLVDAFEKRSRRVCLPGYVRAALIARPLGTTPLVEGDFLKAAPEMRQAFMDEVGASDAEHASMPERFLVPPSAHG